MTMKFCETYSGLYTLTRTHMEFYRNHVKKISGNFKDWARVGLVFLKHCYFQKIPKWQHKLQHFSVSVASSTQVASAPVTFYFEVFHRFLKIIILLEDNINGSLNFVEIVSNDLKNFCDRDWAEFSGFIEILG